MVKVQGGRITLTRGDSGFFSVNITGYELQDGDKLILNVREYPSDNASLLFSSVNSGNVIRINSEDTNEAKPGVYSAQIFLRMTNGDEMQIWPNMSGIVKENNLKNFVISPEVSDNE